MKNILKSKFKFTIITPIILVGLIITAYVVGYILTIVHILPCKNINTCTDEGLFVIFMIINSILVSVIGLIVGGFIDIIRKSKKVKN